MSVLIVDWLGRGGIAQTSEAWAIELTRCGVPVQVVTRPGRELGSGPIAVDSSTDSGGRLASHRSLARAAARLIRERRPETVVVQNYVIPALERPVFEAARAVDAQIVVVVHDHRLHTWQAGTRTGLARELRAADVVLTHSRFVAEGVRRFSRRSDVSVLPLPVPVGMLSHERVDPQFAAVDDGTLWCGHFGVLKRRYKGTNVVEELAAARDPAARDHGWRFLAVGVGAPVGNPNLVACAHYVEPGSLVGFVAATDATMVPYRWATQSAVVGLAQVLGSVPVASAVGGIPEQVTHGVDGILVAGTASLSSWRDALRILEDDEVRKELAVAGVERAWNNHDRFVRGITSIVA